VSPAAGASGIGSSGSCTSRRRVSGASAYARLPLTRVFVPLAGEFVVVALGRADYACQMRTLPLHGAISIRRLAGIAALVVVAGAMMVGERLVEQQDGALDRVRDRHRRRMAEAGASFLPSRGAWLQREQADCGVAVFREAVRSLAVRRVPSWDSAAVLIGMSSRGADLDTLAAALHARGIRARRADRVVDGVLKPPLIAHLTIRHFVLVRSVSAGQVDLFDPLVGEVRIPMQRFQALWSGAAVRFGA
jgi:hypothetical protein